MSARRIVAYDVPGVAGQAALTMPGGAVALGARAVHAASEAGSAVFRPIAPGERVVRLFMLIDPEAAPDERRFHLVETGAPIGWKRASYVGLAAWPDGYELHVFEV